MVFKLKNKLLAKITTDKGHDEESPYFDGWKAYDNDPYHPTMNPNGVIQMGLAENQLSFDLVQEWLKNNPAGAYGFSDIASFQDYHGLPEFRSAVAKFMAMVRGGRVTFDPDRIVLSGGAAGAYEMIAFCLADPGDAFLVPTPYYPGFDRNLRWRTGVQLITVNCESSNQFKITRKALEYAYEMAQIGDIRVKGVLITNPSNPLGTILDKETLTSIVSFINEKNIHLICDEIYATTVFNLPDFISIAEIIEEENCNRDHIHIVYSLSKNTGFPSFQVGIIYSYNDAVVNNARHVSSFGLISLQTQHLIVSMLLDDNFVESFLVQSKKRLARRHSYFSLGLAQVGIECLKSSNAGLFVWMDLRSLLKEQTFEEETKLWRTIINDAKLTVSPGSSFHCNEPGWFRVCFANMDDQIMEVALSRIINFVLRDKEAMKPMKKLRWKDGLRLNFSSRIYDDFMSPHSPMLQSPLVRART